MEKMSNVNDVTTTLDASGSRAAHAVDVDKRPVDPASKHQFLGLMNQSFARAGADTKRDAENRRAASGTLASGVACAVAEDGAASVRAAGANPDQQAAQRARVKTTAGAVSDGAPAHEARDDASARAPLSSAQGFTPTPTLADAAPVMPAPPAPSADLADLLRRLCSAAYVAGETAAGDARLMLALDSAMPGASVEMARAGAFLHVRLHVKDDAAFRVMWTRRDLLHMALADATDLHVSVEVVHDGNTGDVET
jgi:hypothetical protein